MSLASAGIPTPRGFPLRIWPLALVVIVWNLLLGYEFFAQPHLAAFPGPATVAALALVFGTSVAVLCSRAVQEVFLRPGRRIGEVRPIVLLIAIISGIMALVFTSIYLDGGFRRSPTPNRTSLLTPDAPPVPAVITAPTPTRSPSPSPAIVQA